MKKTILPIIFLIIISGEVLGALASATWTSNNDIQLTINNGENAEFEYRVLAVSNYQGVIGKYSVWFYKQGSNIPLRTYFYNQPTINNGAEGYITIYPSDYLQAGNYYVRVYANDFFGSDNHIITLKVQNITTPLNGTCNAQPTTGNTPLTVNFTGTANGGTGTYTYSWNFNDGTTGNGQQTTHTYNQTGTYNPKLKITDTNNNQITINCPTITATQQTTPLNGTCNAQPTTGNTPLTTELFIHANGGSGIYTYSWNFDDGTTQNTIVNKILHTYYNIGEYTPSVTVTDSIGNSKKIRCQTITARKPIEELKCIANPTSGNVPLGVNFEAVTKYMKPGNDFVMFEWDFGDENVIVTQSSKVKHSYFMVGQYSPKLKGIKFNGEIVYAECPKINVGYGNYTLIADPNGPYKDYVNKWILFDGSGSRGEIFRYVWDFGDGTTAETNTPYIYHLYNNTIGIFNIKLIVYDIYGFSAVNYTTATIIEPTNFTREEERIKDGLWVGRIIITGNEGMQEVIRSNDDIYINIELVNDYDYDLDDARIIIEIPELGIKQKSTAFDLRSGREKDQSITVPIWGARQGWYTVKIIIQDDNVRRVKYRDVYVSNI